MFASASVPLIRAVLILIGLAGVSSYLLGWLMRFLSPRLGYVDYPGGRKAHARPMPMGGGVALVLTLLGAIGGGMLLVHLGYHRMIPGLGWLSNHLDGLELRAPQALGILAGVLILHVMGLVDDVKDLGPWTKFIFQFAAAGLVVIAFHVRLHLFIQSAALSCAVTIVWIVVITNAFNFLDNADGLSAGVALVCSLVLLAITLAQGQIFVSAYLACLAGGVAGFLVHNFNPARMYLGDAGSLPIGFLLGVGSVLTTYYREQNPAEARLAVLIPLVVMAVPLYDVCSVVILRLRAGVSPLKGDRRHFSHRLMRRGLSVRDAVLTVYLACGGTAVAAIVLRQVSPPYAILLFVQTLCIVAIIALLEYQPLSEEDKRPGAS